MLVLQKHFICVRTEQGLSVLDQSRDKISHTMEASDVQTTQNSSH
jgi:hypothetical protein